MIEASAPWRRQHTSVAVLGVTAVAGLVGALVATPAGLRAGMALAVAITLGVISFRLPHGAWYCLIGWLTALGLTRRLVSGFSPDDTGGDPLILVAAACWIVLLAAAANRGAFARRTALTNAVLILWAVLALSAFNPLQGPLTVGLGGALFIVVPMSAFFVGRALVDDDLLSRLLWWLGWLGVAVAAYGMVQTFWGFPSWDEAWIQQEGYAALNVGGVIRPFSSFSAASEYAHFLGLAIVAWIARARGLGRWTAVAGPLALLGASLWYESSRGAVVMVTASIGLMLAARAGVGMARSLAMAAALVAALPILVGQVAPAEFSGDPGDVLVQHQVAGLTDPFGDDSSLPTHITMISRGITSAVREPVGIGVGAITIAGDRFGEGTTNSEGDPGNAPVAAGIAGLLAYGVVVLIAIPHAYRLAATRRDALSLAALGIMTTTFLQWLNGGNYAVVFWPWLVMGWVDAVATARTEGPPAPVAASEKGA